MKRRWRFILPIIGLLLFAGETWESVQMNRHWVHAHRYFWWSSIKLDKHPQTSSSASALTTDVDGGVGWDPDSIHISPGLLARAAVVVNLPAFIVGGALLRLVGRAGGNQVWAFHVAMPILIFSWLFLAGWLLDRQRYRKSLRSSRSG